MANDKTDKTDKSPLRDPKDMELTHLWIRNAPDQYASKKVALEARKAIAVAVLRAGEPISQDTRNAIAELLEPDTSGKGRPSKPPYRWWEVGQLFELNPDIKQEDAAKLLGVELRTLQNGLNYYRQIEKAHDDSLKDEN